ncbi:hypothetical protein ACOHOX_004025, partial [Cronobacter sakazakii]
MKELQYAVDNINSIKKIEIKTSQGNFDISSLLDYTFKGKTVINIEVIESDKPSFLEKYIDDYKSILEPVIVASNQFSICIKGVTGEEFTFGDQQELHDPTYRIGVY